MVWSSRCDPPIEDGPFIVRKLGFSLRGHVLFIVIGEVNKTNQRAFRGLTRQDRGTAISPFENEIETIEAEAAFGLFAAMTGYAAIIENGSDDVCKSDAVWKRLPGKAGGIIRTDKPRRWRMESGAYSVR